MCSLIRRLSTFASEGSSVYQDASGILRSITMRLDVLIVQIPERLLMLRKLTYSVDQISIAECVDGQWLRWPINLIIAAKSITEPRVLLGRVWALDAVAYRSYTSI